MQRVMADVETVIRAHPDQWYMFRRMWPEHPTAAAAPGSQARAAGLPPLSGDPAMVP